MVNGVPIKKKKVICRNLLNISEIKAAIVELKKINWLYKDINDDCIDKVAKEVLEVNKATSVMLEKATKADVADFQC